MIRPLSPLVLVALMLSASELAAQLPIPGAAGLGRRVRPLDARARALGGAAVALHGGSLSALNPASGARFSSAGLWASFMPESRSVSGPDLGGDLDASDFPLGRVNLPVAGDWAIGAAFAGFLDQDWTVQFVDTLDLSTGKLDFQETRVSDGGVSQFRLEVARSLSDRVNVGVAGLIYRGEVRRSVERLFPASENFEPYDAGTAIQYAGWGLAGGLEFQPVEEMILGASVSWGPGLEATNDTSGAQVEFDLPFMLDVGGSWLLTPDLVVAINAGWEGWSAVDDRLVTGGTNNAWRAGLGFELRALRGMSSAAFLRLGGRIERLSYELRGGAPWERALSFGLGAEFGDGRGRLDTALELGTRGDEEINRVEETFTRLTFSLAIFAE